jgi:hypothetical protein
MVHSSGMKGAVVWRAVTCHYCHHNRKIAKYAKYPNAWCFTKTPANKYTVYIELGDGWHLEQEFPFDIKGKEKTMLAAERSIQKIVGDHIRLRWVVP